MSDLSQPFPVVGIGASAGALPALTRLLERMPPASGMALVVVVHLSAEQPSIIGALLQRATTMPVLQVGPPVRIAPGCVYVIPPGCNLRMADGMLTASLLERVPGDPVTIDLFLRTLAESHGEHAIGVVLSGMGADGVAGLAAIRERGGVTIAQLPDEAEEGSMPQAAIDAGVADFVLPASRIPHKLAELRDIGDAIRRQGLRGNAPADADGFALGPAPRAALDEVLALLRARTGHDFQHYKHPTLLRRLERRLQLRGVADLDAYCRVLERDQDEADALLKDLLIGVTAFFRDRDAFDVLERIVVPELFHAKGPDDAVRAWVAACASGEEAYSLAMLLSDHAATMPLAPKFQIFASDIDERAIAIARAGKYPPAAMAEVAPERLGRHVVEEDGICRIRRPLRERILFAAHNLLRDPAFSRLDLVSCRNILIYLNRDIHRYVLETFHFGLNPGGYLFLGSAESADIAPDLFVPVDATHRIYRARPAATSMRRHATGERGTVGRAPAAERFDAGLPRRPARAPSFAELHRDQLARLAAPSLLLTGRGKILHASAEAARFLRYAGGEPSRDVLALALPELRMHLQAALFQARKTGAAARSAPVRMDGAIRPLAIVAVPFPAPDWVEHPDAADGLLIVQFEDAGAAAADPDGSGAAGEGQAASGMARRELEDALHGAQALLRQVAEQAESAGSDMASANEELQRTVEEMRASIDALETGREELQSRNEELMTVNAELRIRVEETAKANDDLSNLIASTDIATLFLDRELRIKRYTPRVTGIFNVLPADVGRPLADLTHRLDYPQLGADIDGVFARPQPVEREVRSKDGHDYIVRVHPYRTAEERIDGVVLTFFDISGRRRVEQALRESEARYLAELETEVRERTAQLKQSRDLLQATADASTDMIQVFEAVRGDDGTIVDFRWILNNRASENHYGDVRGASLLERQPGVVAEGIFDTFRQVVETGQSNQAERHYVHEQFDSWFLQSVVKLGDGVATTTKDIGEWKRAQDEVLRLRDEAAQAELRASEEKYRHLIDVVPAAVVACNADGSLAYCNARAVELLGQSPAGADAACTLYGAAPAADGSPMAFVLAAGEPVVDRELRVVRPDGSAIDILVNITALRDADGRITGAINIFQDISDRKQGEAALRASEARFRALAEASPALIWQVDAAGDAVYANRRYLDVTGMAADALPGAVWRAGLHPDDAADYLAAFERALDERAPFQKRVRLRAADGSWHWFESHAVPWHAADQAYRGHVGISIDVNEAVEAEEALRAADRRKDEFLATLAHELRNPLAPISNAVQLLRFPEGRHHIDRLVDMADRQVKQMVRLVDDLMEVTRITRGKIALRRAPTALADILNSAVETSQPALDEMRHRFTLALPDEELVLDADKVRLTQVFANLLNNAAKYTPPEGEIVLAAWRDGRYAVVVVRDTGTGIPAEQLPLVFEMFSQPHCADGASQSGLGIGLAMVRSLVHMHGGTVEARSGGAGQGSEFVVRLPLPPPDAPAGRDEAHGRPALPLARRRTLVVDDNRDAADSLCHLLETLGAEARAVYSGPAALEALEALRPHAVVLDIGMPGMDGYEVARAIRADHRFDGVRIIALTGWGQHVDRLRSDASGFDYHLTKPADMALLESLLAQA